MKFRKVSKSDMDTIVILTGGYVGGSNLDSFEDFKAYIMSKKLRTKDKNGTVKAANVYSVCSYRESQNAQSAETSLLELCDGSCPYNAHGASNIQPVSGRVYVLHD